MKTGRSSWFFVHGAWFTVLRWALPAVTILAGLLASGCINPVFNLNTPLVINRGVSVATTGPARGTNAAVNVILTVEGGGLAGASAAVAGPGAAAVASPSPVGLR